MKSYKKEQLVDQLEKRKGGYYFLKIDAAVVNQFEKKKQTRLICTLDQQLSFQCGLNHLGDGNYFIIISGKNLKSIGKSKGDPIYFELKEDPNPLGIEWPEVLEVLLEQDRDLKGIFQKLTPGKQRSIIHQMNKIKDIDKQVSKTVALINLALKPRPKKA